MPFKSDLATGMVWSFFQFELKKLQKVILIKMIYMFKINNKNTRTRCEICPKLTKKTPEQRHWRCYAVFIVNFEHISQLVLVFLMLTLNM